jgi:SNF2 family DNA or RNA helicase
MRTPAYAVGQQSAVARLGLAAPNAKLAELATPLKEHQQRVINRLQTQPGLVVAHGLGSGKTLSSIAAAESLGDNATVVLPAALRANYQKELDKHVTNPTATYDLKSLQGLARRPDLAPTKTLIVDEAHRLRNPDTKGYKAIADAAAEKRLLLTGTPVYNRPHDIAALVNLAAGENVLPSDQAAFDKRYIGSKTVDPGWFARTFKGIKPGTVPALQNEKELGAILGKWVDLHENNTEGFPSRKDEEVLVPMSPPQQALYEGIMKSAPGWVDYKIRHRLPPDKKESKDLNAFLTAARQVSNTPLGYDAALAARAKPRPSPKVREAFARLKKNLEANPQHKAVIYSNFLESGLNPYAQLLAERGVPYAMFTGSETARARNQAIQDYNEGRLRALLVSGAGGEGLDLKGTRQIQLLEPHFNNPRQEQVVGRGIRFGSHADLPEDQRNVNVEHYYSTMPEPSRFARFFGAKREGSIDEYLRDMAANKEQLAGQLHELLKANQPK